MKKVISGIVFIAFLIVLGITDCPICNEIICKCDTVQAQEVPQEAQNEPLSEETEEVDVTICPFVGRAAGNGYFSCIFSGCMLE